MRRIYVRHTGNIERNESYEAIPGERKIANLIENKEPIDSTAPVMYTDRKDGVLAGTDIRTDRWDVALEAIGKMEKSRKTKRDSIGEEDGKNKNTESIQTTE